jgi:hypothetical protein
MSHGTANALRLAVLASGLVACGSAGSPLAPDGPSLATRTDRSNIRVEFVLSDVDNPCTPGPDGIDLSGIIHGQGAAWDNGHFNSHYNVNLSGVDDNGVRYQGSSTGNGNLGSPVEDMVISTVLNSTGGAPNFVSKIVLHHHKDGTTTVDKAGEECRG